MKRISYSVMVSLIVLMFAASARALTCPSGQHQVCHGGSGRGGGYHSTCSCVNNPPPVCTTAWGTQILAGTSILLYDVNIVYAPDTCTAHAATVSCDLTTLTLSSDKGFTTGYPICNVVYDTGGDDNGD